MFKFLLSKLFVPKEDIFVLTAVVQLFDDATQAYVFYICLLEWIEIFLETLNVLIRENQSWYLYVLGLCFYVV